VDRDESRFAQAMRQVAEAARSGDWNHLLVPHIQDRPRINKPPLVYWLAIPGSLALDHPDRDIGVDVSPLTLPTGNIFAYRLVSLLSAMVAVILTWRIGLALRFHPTAAWLGGALLATCVMVMWDARQARADETLLACTTGAMLCLAHIWRRRDLPLARTRGWVVGLIIWLALGVLAKGISLLVVGLAATSLGLWTRGNGAKNWVRHLRAPWVVLASIAPIALWFIATRMILGSGAAESTAAKETFWRALIPQESHWGPPGYHLVLLAILFFPGSLATGSALRRALRRTWSTLPKKTVWTRIRAVLVGPVRADDRTMFCLAWIVLPWIVFELVMTKLPHYTLPMYPAIALLSAREVLRMGARMLRPGLWGRLVYCAIALGIGAGVPLALELTNHFNRVTIPTQFWIMVLMIGFPAFLGLVMFVPMAWHLHKRRPVIALTWAMGVSIMTFIFAIGTRLPAHPDLWISSRLMTALSPLTFGRDRPLACVGYHEDSLIFLTRGRIERVGAKRIEQWFADHPDGIAVVERGSWEFDPDRFAATGAVAGFNYSSGEHVVVDVITIAPPAYDAPAPSHP